MRGRAECCLPRVHQNILEEEPQRLTDFKPPKLQKQLKISELSVMKPLVLCAFFT
jgi:biotin carboxylase